MIIKTDITYEFDMNDPFYVDETKDLTYKDKIEYAKRKFLEDLFDMHASDLYDSIGYEVYE